MRLRRVGFAVDVPFVPNANAAIDVTTLMTVVNVQTALISRAAVSAIAQLTSPNAAIVWIVSTWFIATIVPNAHIAMGVSVLWARSFISSMSHMTAKPTLKRWLSLSLDPSLRIYGAW